MDECQRCKELEVIILSLQNRIEELERLLGTGADVDDSDNSGGCGYLDRVKKKKPGKQFGKNKKTKKRGARKGHPGSGRRKCEAVDREVDLRLDKCPDCGAGLRENRKPEQYVQEDLEIRTVATKISVHRYECPCCKKNVKAQFEPGFIGPVAKSLSSLLHYYSGIPFNKIKECFGWFGLVVSEGSLADWGRKCAERFEVSYENLKESLRKSAYVNVDETGWPVDGKNQWLWVFRSPESVVYRIDASRGSAVVRDILGDDYGGVLGSDFFSAYNPIDCKKQKCLVHLMRAVKDWDESDSFEKRSLRYGLRRIISDAKNLANRRETLTPCDYEKKVSGFLSDYGELLKTDFRDPDCHTLMKRLKKHGSDLWTFLSEPVPCHNNSAELAIRRAVVNRKVSNGNRSAPGARIQEKLLTVIQTAKLHGKNLMKTLLNKQEPTFDSA
jgi:transposase